jgi:hypothetical protein
VSFLPDFAERRECCAVLVLISGDFGRFCYIGFANHANLKIP